MKNGTENHGGVAVAEEAKALNNQERELLAQCESTIQQHFETFKEAGAALQQIRELRLYRENFVSFDEYCRAKWDMTKTQANRIISASKVSEDLAKTLPKAHEVIEHLTESAVRPLTMLTPKARLQVMRRVVKETPTARAITAAHITQVAKELAPDVFARRGIKPSDGKAKRKPEGDLIRRSELLSAINKWAKSKDLNKLSPRQILTGVKDIIRGL